MDARLQTNVTVTGISTSAEMGELAKLAGHYGFRLNIHPPPEDEPTRTAQLIRDEGEPLLPELVRLSVLLTQTSGMSVQEVLGSLEGSIKMQIRGIRDDLPFADQPGIGEIPPG